MSRNYQSFVIHLRCCKRHANWHRRQDQQQPSKSVEKTESGYGTRISQITIRQYGSKNRRELTEKVENM